jgi:membrane associated rhomboid family serine protease
MTAPAPTLDTLLQLCAEAAPRPWRPSVYAREHGVDRDSLDEPLNLLRIAGLVRLTEWEPGIGQGYVPTEAGFGILGNPRGLAELRRGVLKTADTRATPSRPEATFERGERVRAAVFSPHPAPMTRALIVAQLVAFALGLYLALTSKISFAEYLRSGRSPLIEWFAVSPLHLARGEWWVLLTSALVHVGGLHLMFNLVSLGAIGPQLEGMLGSMRFLIVWLISVLGGGVAVAIAGSAAAGSSGGLFGLIGAQAAFVAIYHPHIGRQATGQFRTWLVKSAIIGVAISLMPGVSGAGHLGGAIAGLLSGGLLALNRFGRLWQRGIALFGVVALPVVGVGYLSERGILRTRVPLEQIAAGEFADFDERLRPEVDQLESKARDVEDSVVGPLRSLRPERRPADRVRAALVSLGDLHARQLKLLETVVRTGRYQTPHVEAARRAIEDLLQKRMAVCRMYEECFRRGSNWNLERNEYDLQQLLNLTVEAEILYLQTARRVSEERAMRAQSMSATVPDEPSTLRRWPVRTELAI